MSYFNGFKTYDRNLLLNVRNQDLYGRTCHKVRNKIVIFFIECEEKILLTYNVPYVYIMVVLTKIGGFLVEDSNSFFF